MFSRESTYTLEEKMDQSQARETAKDAADQASKAANDAVQRVGEQVQPALDRGKAAVQDLANQASQAGRQVADRAGEFIEGVAPQARQVASNLYDQGSRSGEYVRRYFDENRGQRHSLRPRMVTVQRKRLPRQRPCRRWRTSQRNQDQPSARHWG